MKIVSPLGIALAVLLAALVVGCSSGPGQAPADDMPAEEMPEPPATPATQEFTGTFEPAPDPTNPSTGTITATIIGISHDGTALTDAALAAALAQLGAEQTFNYTVATTMEGTTITLTGGLIDALIAPGASVTANRSEPATDLVTALFGTWTAAITDPETMATTNLTLVTAPPNGFTLTVAPAAAPASS